MKRSLIGIVAIVGAALVVTAGATGKSAARSGALHVTKECSEYQGLPGQFCTILSSNIPAIKPGMRVVYLQALGPAGLDSDLVLTSGHGPQAFGHVVLSVAPPPHGTVTFSGGTGRFEGFQANVAVTVDTKGVWHWDGTYSFPTDDD
jgi:hypothetical protein